MKKRIAFFDFDGTITTKDSLLSFILFRYGKRKTYLGLLKVSPFYVAHLFKLISVQAAKQKVLRQFFRNESVESFNASCNQFAMEILPGLERSKAMKEIKLLQEKGADVVVISASPYNYLHPWCKQLGVELICTNLATKDGKLTGKIEGNNCRGEEKVRRIQSAYKLDEYDEVYAYGDTKGDKPMLELATFRFYKPFR